MNDEIVKQIADLNRNIEKLFGMLSPPSATHGVYGLHVYIHQVPPIMPEKPAYGTASDPRSHSISFTAPGRRTQVQTY